ncbi:MAG: hypothetical protein ACF8Q5_02540 [Phycisphaerales bacterium JB040]
MPPLPTPKTGAMADLLERLLPLDRSHLLAALPRLERLARDLDAERLYPETEVLNKVLDTSHNLSDPRQLVGAAVLTDLSVLAERVSDAARLRADEMDPPPVTLDELQERWSVSKKTIDRYRRKGLIGRRAVGASGRTNLVFAREAVEAFERANPERLARAERFQRTDDGLEARLIARAERYHRRLRCSLNQAARRLAVRFGLSHEGVRQILLRARREGRVDLPTTPPPTTRERLVAVRASRRGHAGSPEALAARWKRSKASARRALNEGRADLLRSLAPPALILDADEGETEALLAHPAARLGLGEPGRERLGYLLEAARRRTPPVKAEETARSLALHALRERGARLTSALDPTTASGVSLDRIETDLRWASLLKSALLRPHLALVLQTLEARAGGPIETLGLATLSRWWARALAAASAAVDAYDPRTTGRLAARVGLGVDRAAAELARSTPGAPGRARRAIPDSARLRDWTLSLDPWQRWLAIDPRVRSVLPTLDEHTGDPRLRRTLALRHGLAGGGEAPDSPAGPPRTLEEVAGELGTARVHVARFEREALSAALCAARQAARTMGR